MAEHQVQVCPWCQSEIVWDEEFGPEKTCPHCYNELTDYRTLAVPLKPERSSLYGEGLDDQWNRYTRSAERIIDAQGEVLECPQCQEYMVNTGEIVVAESNFSPRESGPGLPPFLQAPFRMELFVCSHCFTALQRIGEKDRKELIQRLGEKAPEEL